MSMMSDVRIPTNDRINKALRARTNVQKNKAQLDRAEFILNQYLAALNEWELKLYRRHTGETPREKREYKSRRNLEK